MRADFYFTVGKEGLEFRITDFLIIPFPSARKENKDCSSIGLAVVRGLSSVVDYPQGFVVLWSQGHNYG